MVALANETLPENLEDLDFSLPFLLVLLFQLGFGLSPLAAGLLTFAGVGGGECAVVCGVA